MSYVNITLINTFKVLWNRKEEFKNVVVYLGDFHFMKENFQASFFYKPIKLIIAMVQGVRDFNKVSIFSSQVPKGCSSPIYMFDQEIKRFILSKNDLSSKQIQFFKSNLIMPPFQLLVILLQVRDSRMLYSNPEYALLAVCQQYYLEHITTMHGIIIQLHFIFDCIIIFVFYILYVSDWSKLSRSHHIIIF